jgi:hypothetical protein
MSTKFTRRVSESQVVDVVARRVMGESLRKIEKATGLPRSTVSDLLRAPDVVALVKSEQDAIHAVEQAQAETLREAKKRDTSRRSSAKHREAVAREEFATGQVPGNPPPRSGKRKRSPDAADGAILGVMTFPAGAEGFARDPETHWVPNRVLEAEQRGTTSEADLDAIDARINPERVPLSAIRVPGQEGQPPIFSRSFDKLADDLGKIADDLIATAGFPSAERNAIITALADCPPGKCVEFEYAEPEEPPR